MSRLERGCRGRRAWCVGLCVCVPEGLFEAIYIINPLLTVLPYYRTAAQKWLIRVVGWCIVVNRVGSTQKVANRGHRSKICAIWALF